MYKKATGNPVIQVTLFNNKIYGFVRGDIAKQGFKYQKSSSKNEVFKVQMLFTNKLSYNCIMVIYALVFN